MIGAVIVTHGTLAEALLESARTIVESAENVAAIGVKGDESFDELKAKISLAIKSVDSGSGVMVFTDMFGGTPANIVLTLHEEGRIEVLTGVNLPLMIKFLTARKGRSLKEFSSALVEHGRKSIVLASGVLGGAGK
ncbi:MAG: PTS sugar transporter subunit IIA [Deltaproteobacteria bacterium]|nr:PTS sugar transporter subunit IIA [Deltaproteobacteria bacterium]